MPVFCCPFCEKCCSMIPQVDHQPPKSLRTLGSPVMRSQSQMGATLLVAELDDTRSTKFSVLRPH